MLYLLKIVLVVILSIFIKDNRSQNFPVVPCPDVFEYITGDDRNFGIITIPTPKEGRWTTVNVSIGSNGKVHNSDRFLYLYKSKNESAEDAQKGKPIQYIILLPSGDEIPIIKNIYLNGEVICRGLNIFYHNNWSFKHSFFFGKTSVRIEHSSNIEETFPTVFDWFNAQPKFVNYLPNLQMKPMNGKLQRMGDDGSWLEDLPFKCGVKPLKVGRRINSDLRPATLILNGTAMSKGEFPWMVYLEYDSTIARGTICGGTLVSDRHIITAAHCVHGHRIIAVQLGKHDTYVKEEGSIRREPLATVVHPEFKKAHADIAIIFIDPVPFSTQIFPACIWPFGLRFDEQFQYGTVAGWGIYINDVETPHSRIPMKTFVPIVSLEMCRQSHTIFETLATDDVICAGGQYTGPCKGDSGSGFYFQHMKTWYLRGVVSSGLSDVNSRSSPCQTNHYAVYVDISFYLDWLRPYIMDIDNEIIRITSRIDTRFKDKARIEINT